MTKFDSVAISHRKGKQSATYTTAELRRNMAIFKATGAHPELDARAASAAEESGGLPVSDPGRPHVFFELVTTGADTETRTTIGVVVVEVFEDLVPASAKTFVLRATGGGAGLGGFVAYESSTIHRVVNGVRLDGGGSQAVGDKNNNQGGGVPLEPSKRTLAHAATAVSLASDGPNFTVAIGACPHLDGKQQVVGRVTLGMDVIERIAQVKVDDDFAPVQKIQIGACGLTGPGGAGAAIAGKLRAERAAAAAHAVATTRLETKQDTSARLARESELLGAGIKRSLQHGLRNEGLKKTKTKTETGGATRGGMYDVLGDVPSDDDSDETSDEDA
jgi:cyclophilin family peptidyl-prolyl cis-trans isomerase